MREFEHFIVNGEILLPDPRSAKAAYGLHQAEFLDETSPHFLRKGHTTFPRSEVVYQLTEASEPIGIYQGKPCGQGMIIVESEQFSGFFAEMGVHTSKVVWDEK